MRSKQTLNGRLAGFAIIAQLLNASVFGQGFETFESGSDGSDGELIVPSGESRAIILPDEGILNYTSVSIDGSVTFGRNSRNTPVYVLATKEIVIGSSGSIDVSGFDGSSTMGGFGGPGGWSGGAPGLTNSAAGNGQGPGGGRVGEKPNFRNGDDPLISGGGSYSSKPDHVGGADFHGGTYGSALLLPLLGGSGGAGSVKGSINSGGGGGGGAVLLASSVSIEVVGRVLAEGGTAGGGPQGGSGGAVRLVSPRVFGGGRIEAGSKGSNGGFGRVRIDTSAYGPQTPTIRGASGSIGANTVIFPQNAPDLRLTDLAGTSIDPNGTGAISINLPADGNSVQPVTVEAENFNGSVVFVVHVVPERGPALTTEGTIDNKTTNPASTTVDVSFPLDSSAQVYVWPKQLVSSE